MLRRCHCLANYQCDFCWDREGDVFFLEYDQRPPTPPTTPPFLPSVSSLPAFRLDISLPPPPSSFSEFMYEVPSSPTISSPPTPNDALPIAFGDLPTPPRPVPSNWYPSFFDRLPNLTQSEEEEEETSTVPNIPLFQRTPPAISSTRVSIPLHTPPLSPIPFHLLDENDDGVATPTATDATEDLLVEQVVLLDPLTMHAGSTPFQRKPKKPRCKKQHHTDGWVSIKYFKREITE